MPNLLEEGTEWLADELQAALEIFRGKHLLEQRAREGLPGVHVLRHAGQHVPFPAEVLHELAGQLDRVPFHAVDARHAEVLDACEQVVQAMPELVEQRQHFVVREERRLVADRAREVAV